MAGEYVEFVNNSQPALNEDNLNLMQQRIKQDIQGAVSGDTLPVGAIMPFGSDTLPENWLLCNGQAVSRTEYQDLYNTIGTTFGQGDGFATFNLPDLQGKVVVGKDGNDTDFDTLGETGGEKTHTLTVQEMPNHTHNMPIQSFVNSDEQNNFIKGGHVSNQAQGTNYATRSTGGGQPHNILQPYQVQNYIIKAKQSAGIVAQVIDNLNSISTTDALSANQGKVLKEKMEIDKTTGVEVETNDFINGNKVYVKRIDCGTIAAETATTTSTGVTNVTYVDIKGGFVYTDTNGNANFVPVNCYFNQNLIIGAFIQNNNVRVYATALGGRTGTVYCDVYYTKNS